ncbi:MAG: DUF1064 domain-containing protein [Burkholderiaceae bacterium]|nr:DUF1064 domain-containing protein [Burkholderiaceae bacterium]
MSSRQLRLVVPRARASASKYRNKRIEVDGQKFDSKAELARYQQLVLLERAGRISELTRQVSFVLAPAAVVAGKPKRALVYRADFQYVGEDGEVTVEDVKGALTEAYKIKRHLMVTVHGIQISEVR